MYGKKTESYYQEFEIPKKSGGTRIIHAPKDPLKRILQTISKELCLVQQLECNIGKVPHGFIKGRSIFTNAQPHVNKMVVINVDIENFFGSINFGRIYGYFKKDKRFMLNNKVAGMLANLLTYNGVLPQGSPASPVISNLLFNIVDKRILKLVKKYKLTYTRYADDLTFSTNRKEFMSEIDQFLIKLEKIIVDSGYSINPTKTRINTHDERQEVTGLVVNRKVNFPKEYFKNTKAMVHSYYKNEEFYIEGKAGTLSQLLGRFSYIEQINEYNKKRDKRISTIMNVRYKRNYMYNRYIFEYSRFMIYNYIFNNEYPLIVTEGKTDSRYLVSAIRSIVEKEPHAFPDLAELKNGKVVFKVRFLSNNNKISQLLGCGDGGHSIINIYNSYIDICHNNSSVNVKPAYSYYLRFGRLPKNPVFLLYDHEIKKDKPLHDLIHKGNYKKHNVIKNGFEWPDKSYAFNLSISFDREQMEMLNEDIIEALIDKEDTRNLFRTNLYATSFQSMKDSGATEIEDLFKNIQSIPGMEGRIVDKKGEKHDPKYISKNDFSLLVMNQYKKIDFSNFREYLDLLNRCIDEFDMGFSEC